MIGRPTIDAIPIFGRSLDGIHVPFFGSQQLDDNATSDISYAEIFVKQSTAQNLNYGHSAQ